VLGAVRTVSGRSEVEQLFDCLARNFSNCESYHCEVIAADVSGDLGYVVGIEHSTASVDGATPEAYDLRVTEVFRREAGDWKVVHRHADPMPDSDAARRAAARLVER
jgi:ketosteroid isomerase-like protein